MEETAGARGHEAVRAALRVLDAAGSRVTLAELARETGVSPHHLQRLFTRSVGCSPARYQDALRADAMKARLREGASVSDAAYSAGFGSSRGVYEGGAASLGMTPAKYRRGGDGLRIAFDILPSALGRLLVAGTARGVCAVYLGDDDARLAEELRAEFPRAELVRDAGAVRPWAREAVRRAEGEASSREVPLDLRGTSFQLRVWAALREIPVGETRTYREVAEAIGRPRAVRAVAGACAANKVSLLVPCHRVVRTGGGLGGYRWGVERKRRLLEAESSR